MNTARRSSALLIAALIGIGVVAGRLMPELVQRVGGHSPEIGWTPAGSLFLAALLICGLAWSMWQAVHRKKRTVHAEHALRMLAVAKACIWVGALFTGGYAGFALAFVAFLDTQAGQSRVVHAAAAAAAALLLLVAALLLERACVLPGASDDDPAASPKTSPA